MIKLEMKNCNSILIEKLPKYLLYLEEKIDKNEYLTGEEISPSNQMQITEQAKFIYPPLRKAFEKQTKKIEKQFKIKDKLKIIKEHDYNDKDIPLISHKKRNI